MRSGAVALLVLGILHAGQAQEVNFVKPPPREPVGEVKSTKSPDGSTVRTWKNEWGYTVTDCGSGSTFISIPPNLLEAPGPEQERADAYRAQGFVFVDRISGDSIRRVSPCLYEVSWTLSTKVLATRQIEVGCLVVPHATAVVAVEEQGVVRYSYDFGNAATATQSIIGVQLDIPKADIVFSKEASLGWRASDSDQMPSGLTAEEWGNAPIRVSWSPHWLPGTDSSLRPGGSVSGLSFKSTYLPALTTAYFRGHPNASVGPGLPENFSGPLNRAFSDLLRENASVKVVTIGPQIPPFDKSDQVGRASALARLADDVVLAATGGMVPSDRVAVLRDLFQYASARTEDPEAAKSVASAIAKMDGLSSTYRDAVLIVLRTMSGS